MSDISPLSPEARRESGGGDATHAEARWFARLGFDRKTIEVAKRVAVGVYTDGFAMAGNFAYLSLLAIFSFFTVAAAVAGIFGQSEAGLATIDSVFRTVPPNVAEALEAPISSAMTARSGPLLWLSGLIGLWTTGSLIETIRDVLHRSYGVQASRPFWQYRLRSIVVIIAAVVLLMLALWAQVMVVAAEQFVTSFMPWATSVLDYVFYGRIIPFIILFASLYTIFRTMTPRQYRDPIYPKWPGAALVSAWWVGCVTVLPLFLANVGSYDLTYGSLAGVMISLIFFYLIGLGMVTGAELNAALANQPNAQPGAANGV